ncbi:hypothetical protein DSECCO2_143960 [anaerobic digester metagenome]
MLRIRQVAILLLIFVLCIGTVTAAVDRTITPPDAQGTITVRVTFPDGMIGGITEVIPAGYTFLRTTHPADQTRTDGSKVHFAILGEESITYTLSGPAIPEISGTVLDLTDGIASSKPPAKQSPAPVAAAIFGVILATFALIRRGRP